MMDIKGGLLLLFINVLVKTLQVMVLISLANKPAFNNELIAEESHKPITKKFLKSTIYSKIKTMSGLLI